MARLTHNDYLEQFSDSGIVGGVFYAAWILTGAGGGWSARLGIWQSDQPSPFSCGLLGWFIQGLGEFGLYIPALAWTAFTLLGGLLGLAGNQIDKPAAAN